MILLLNDVFISVIEIYIAFKWKICVISFNMRKGGEWAKQTW
jgi:hypothetical protein